jgi:HEAT repeat protein
MDEASVSIRGFGALGLALLVHRNGDEELRGRVATHLRRRLARGRLQTDLEGATVTALGLLADRESTPLVRKVFEEEGEPHRRGHAALALGLMGDRESLPSLRRALEENRDPWVRREVALALGLLRDSDSVRTLVEMVRSGRTEYARANAALALGRTGGPTASRGMIELLGRKSASGPTRGMAAIALGYLLDRRPISRVAEVAEDLDYTNPLGVLRELLTIL